MKITVRIETIEVIIDRPDFKEERYSDREYLTMEKVIIPSLAEATKQAKELYNLKHPSDGTTTK